jgi:hypothetical protein
LPSQNHRGPVFSINGNGLAIRLPLIGVVWALHVSGAADFEAVPGREEYDLGEDGSAAWAQDMLEFADDNFNDAGIEVRSMDMRDRQVGLFGDFCERMGHGKFVEWRADEESGGLYKLEMVTQVRATCLKSERESTRTEAP